MQIDNVNAKKMVLDFHEEVNSLVQCYIAVQKGSITVYTTSTCCGQPKTFLAPSFLTLTDKTYSVVALERDTTLFVISSLG